MFIEQPSDNHNPLHFQMQPEPTIKHRRGTIKNESFSISEQPVTIRL